MASVEDKCCEKPQMFGRTKQEKEKEKKLGFEISVVCGFFFLHLVHNPESTTTISNSLGL